VAVAVAVVVAVVVAVAVAVAMAMAVAMAVTGCGHMTQHALPGKDAARAERLTLTLTCTHTQLLHIPSSSHSVRMQAELERGLRQVEST
jgi:FlaG/FlaF family flagellin (archaellin)